MNKSKSLRESTRILERNLEGINSSDCCLCSASTAQCHALVEIGRSKDSMLKDLAATLRIDVSTASKIVDELVKKNLVLREPSASDRRSVQINLSPSGTEIFNRIEKDMNGIFRDILAYINPSECDMVMQSLSIYNHAIEQWKAAKQHECNE